MAILAIKGHATRSKEVIEILEMLGGKNPHSYIADCDSLCFSIGKGTNTIYYDWVKDCYEDKDILVFTLEEFLEKFPYNVGDKVSSKYLKNYKIEKAEWESINNRVIYKLQGMGWYSVEELQPYKEETMEERDEKAVNHVYETEVISFDIAQKDKYELDLQGKFEVVLREGKYYVERIKPKYPNTYEECCKILQVTHTEWQGYLGEVLVPFQKLLICRNAYWMIAGEQMGLGKPWEPELNSKKHKFALSNVGGNISFEVYGEYNSVLCFPTEEMRDAFYENFKYLIEQCKDFL